jgi:glycogen phosphorylase
MINQQIIAYFSMEIGIDTNLSTYSGGLGVLAGDTIRSAADLEIPMVGVSLLYRKGYFYQKLDSEGNQREEPVEWKPEDYLEDMPVRVTVQLANSTVSIRTWKHVVKGIGGFTVPVYFLDTDLDENSEEDRQITNNLYGGDDAYRLRQETVLGIGGLKMLRALGYTDVFRYHMNEGHASLLTFELLVEEAGNQGRRLVTPDDIETVRQKCVFTTHTPVPAGHDKFPKGLALEVLGNHPVFNLESEIFIEDTLNMTYLALRMSNYINGVAKKHGEVSRLMFAQYDIDSITNGVHVPTWTSEPFQKLYDTYIPGWRGDNLSLRYALKIPRNEIWNAHSNAKRELIRYVNNKTNAGLERDVFTIGFARRATPYKRASLLFSDIERIKRISEQTGRFQIIYAGKAHPRDEGGKELIREIFRIKELLKNDIKIVYLENYDIDLGKLLTSGVDLWLNTPQAPLEASGTSGMKAALNGIPSLSVLDGWWIEGHIEGVTGWSIGKEQRADAPVDDGMNDAGDLYDKLEYVILPLYYRQRDRYIDVMQHSIALNGSFFNTKRMVLQYLLKAYHKGIVHFF